MLAGLESAGVIEVGAVPPRNVEKTMFRFESSFATKPVE
jgi:hypothetical protein